MVKLSQIDDETATTFEQSARAPPQGKVEEYSDSESELESDYDDEFDIENETLYDRVVALRDIIPPKQRTQLALAAAAAKLLAVSGLNKSGFVLWTLTLSALLLGVPLLLAILAETQLQEMEKEMLLQQSAQEVLAPGSETAFQEPAKA